MLPRTDTEIYAALRAATRLATLFDISQGATAAASIRCAALRSMRMIVSVLSRTVVHDAGAEPGDVRPVIRCEGHRPSHRSAANGLIEVDARRAESNSEAADVRIRVPALAGREGSASGIRAGTPGPEPGTGSPDRLVRRAFDGAPATQLADEFLHVPRCRR